MKSKAFARKCLKCGELYPSDAPGSRWVNNDGKPRYLHPGCEKPAAGWVSAEPGPVVSVKP